MPARKQWVFDPHSGGQKIPEAVKVEITRRIERVAEKQFKGFFLRLDVRFKGQFCYIDADREYRMRRGGRMPKLRRGKGEKKTRKKKRLRWRCIGWPLTHARPKKW
ncbi:MAG TPA: hypothetical protein VJL59_16095 [Anaerolineales bacterium]|nr:hypothetical protein [Anaerolineales bacterium]